MPRFYFHMSNGVFIPDNKGKYCTTRKAAEGYAVKMAAEYGRNHGYVPVHLCVSVADEMGVEVFRTSIVNHARKLTAEKKKNTPAL